MPTIALVDDDRNILTSLRMLLEAEGYKILAYTDGVSLLMGLQEIRPISPFSISRCQEWTGWSFCGVSAKN